MKIKVTTEESWEEISDVLTPEGITKLRGKLLKREKPVLIFDFEGSPIHLRIKRITRDGKVWAQRTHLYTEEELSKKLGKEKLGKQ